MVRKAVRTYRAQAAVAVVNVAFAAGFVAMALAAFHNPVPHGLPVAVVGPGPAVGRVDAALARHAPGAFTLRRYDGAAAAAAALGRRDVDGALLIGRDGAVRLLVAKAGGTAVAQALEATFTAVAREARRPLRVTDAVPPLPGDSGALSPFFLVLCVLFPSLGTGIAFSHLLRGARPVWRAAVPIAVAVAVGFAVAGVADAFAGLGHYLAIAVIVALFSLAISAPTVALAEIRAPFVAAAILIFLILGVPASGGPAGLASFGPGFLRAVHPALPLGVAADAVRNTIYFHGAATAGHLLVLGAWAAGGLAALGLQAAYAGRRGRRAHGRRHLSSAPA
jgi:hypothetical protein